VINNDLRTSIGEVKCADLVSSCSLVQNSTVALDPTKGWPGECKSGEHREEHQRVPDVGSEFDAGWRLLP
jgi:hypothetical protein